MVTGAELKAVLGLDRVPYQVHAQGWTDYNAAQWRLLLRSTLTRRAQLDALTPERRALKLKYAAAFSVDLDAHDEIIYTIGRPYGRGIHTEQTLDEWYDYKAKQIDPDFEIVELLSAGRKGITVEEAAGLWDVKTSSYTGYVARGMAPQPVFHKGNRAFYDAWEVWVAAGARRGQDWRKSQTLAGESPPLKKTPTFTEPTPEIAPF
ncbi:hypothetical protein BH09ACT9_BH09ACT9_00870 [soil metagenome]